MRPVFPVHLALINQLQIRLVDQSGRLKRVALTFAAQETGCLTMKFLINERQQFIQRFPLTAGPRTQHTCDFMRILFGLVHFPRPSL